jgi:hypothetical protein
MALIRAVELIAKLDSGETQFQDIAGLESCARCATPLQESVTGCRKLKDGAHVCSDCYFRGLGNELEQFPILPPRLRRRA